MGLTGLLALFIVFIMVLFIIIGISQHKKRDTNRKPSKLAVSALLFQITLLVLFFSEILMIDGQFEVILWWGSVLFGFIAGIREYKNHVIFSLIVIFLSIVITILMLLTVLIASM
ncbi:hypothetical protein [Metabacillus malikii]|uniref:Membrane-associated HD superfamily phosphohydrolase n=1 Tax=Metabacillus malikii TaxID=1504265 RepID=A0ABT9ZJM6_9BACI|nr:hypothetical protein [Metabacillus malikii]MDQ0231753.1 membrane-associated HD superfamily phosphohydrolase [Metabacillus malikii]